MRKISETSYIQGIIEGHDLAAKMDIDNQLDWLIKQNKGTEYEQELIELKQMVIKSVFTIVK